MSCLPPVPGSQACLITHRDPMKTIKRARSLRGSSLSGKRVSHSSSHALSQFSGEDLGRVAFVAPKRLGMAMRCTEMVQEVSLGRGGVLVWLSCPPGYDVIPFYASGKLMRVSLRARL